MTKRQIRLHQYLIRTGKFNNKQEILEILKNGEVTVNNKTIHTPDYHLKFSDDVKYKNEKLIAERKNKYIILNKPQGYLSSRLTREDIKLNKKTLFSLLEEDSTLFCIGRLDENTEGLIIITNDGKLSHKVANPKFKVKKTYLIELTEELDNKSKATLEKGIEINNQQLKPLEVKIGSNTKRILIVLDEGKKREIRLMFEKIDYEINKLTRIKIGNLDLSNLKIGLGKTLIVSKEFILENLGLSE
ncbi:rRNA pseudouridine synthase [Candidatus Woesearchaeota archaeon]|jgi:pseudouridine synthase|nr:rRNA pseudouridine synthase [Candidatus Woesearchaeota archaeon]MBT6995345.1 rRNA pseudouridine synthase [Candidatus Woesearchaeota archaeon]MBT7238032.1 rRNA pseudouridine synthase [Candidatus Woesearchaeota archaeon]